MKTYKHCGIALTFAVLGCAPFNGVGASAKAPNQSQALTTTADASNPWVGRSGEAEALADIAAGRPVKLYIQSIAGERAEDRTPGLRNCHPDRFDVPIESLSKFVPLGENYSESIIYTTHQMARLYSATAFARDYNLTIFRKKEKEILMICPSAVMDGIGR